MAVQVKRKVCKNSGTDLVHAKRPAPHPGPRCSTCHGCVRKDRKQIAHGKRVESVYGISIEQYWMIYEAQGGVCFICRRAKGNGKKKLSVDHNHQTGEVRGLLCTPCNRGVLGHLRDDRDAVLRVLAYLVEPPARKVLSSSQETS